MSPDEALRMPFGANGASDCRKLSAPTASGLVSAHLPLSSSTLPPLEKMKLSNTTTVSSPLCANRPTP